MFKFRKLFPNRKCSVIGMVHIAGLPGILFLLLLSCHLSSSFSFFIILLLYVADEGFTDACAGTLLRYRKAIDANNILIFADIKKKHSSHSITSDISISKTVEAAEFFLADGVVLTGTTTGDPVNIGQLSEVKKIAKGPVLIGSGVSLSNIRNYMSADAVIVGSHFKIDGKWENTVSGNRISDFMKQLDEIQSRKQ